MCRTSHGVQARACWGTACQASALREGGTSALFIALHIRGAVALPTALGSLTRECTTHLQIVLVLEL
jgi:hypothetical protein